MCTGNSLCLIDEISRSKLPLPILLRISCNVNCSGSLHAICYLINEISESLFSLNILYDISFIIQTVQDLYKKLIGETLRFLTFFIELFLLCM